MADDANMSVVAFAFLALISLFLMYIFRRKGTRKNAIVLFTRYPKPGEAKTRLIPSLGREGAAAAQVFMTEHIVKVLQTLCETRSDTDVIIKYNGGTLEEMQYWLNRKLHGLQCRFSPQTGSGLGEKLVQAIQDCFDSGHENVVVIGGDIPGIRSDILNEAVEALNKSDVVIGRAEDGGYYLIGVSKNISQSIDKLFAGINWGTSTVYKEQVAVAKDLKLSISTLPQVLQDVDTEADICVFEREVGVNRQTLISPTWSIVIPVFNEEKNIITTLQTLLKNISNPSKICDIVICDGGSTDSTCDVVTKFAQSLTVKIKLAHTKKGQGCQLSDGAKLARGDYYLFTHADTLLPQNYDVHMMQCLQTPGVVASAFGFHLDLTQDPKMSTQESWWFVQQMKFLEKIVSWRSNKKELPYGDQALFLSKKTYNEVGGYPYFRLMEDFILVRKLQTIGHVGICKGQFAITSYRRWRKYGFIRTTGFNQVLLIAYGLGVHPNDLATWYYGPKMKWD